MNIASLSKKLSMVTLAAAMVAAPAINVFAAPEDIIDTSKTASLTIHKYDLTAATEDGYDVDKYTSNGKKNAEAEAELKDYVIQGVEFSYLKVGEIKTRSESGAIQVIYGIPDELADILGIKGKAVEGSYYASDDINKALSDLLTKNTAGKDKLEEYFTTAGPTKMKETDANGITSANSLPLGLYLIVETKVPANVTTTVDPFFVSLPMTDLEGSAWFYDVDVYPKNQSNIPDLDKAVRQHDDYVKYHDGNKDYKDAAEYDDTTTFSEGDVLDYHLISRLPDITSTATYLKQYTFTD